MTSFGLRRSLAVAALVGTVLASALGCSGGESRSAIESVSVLDFDATRCLECGADVDFARLRAFVALRDSVDRAGWAKRSFSDDDERAQRAFVAAKGDLVFVGLSSMLVSSFTFSDGSTRVLYERQRVGNLDEWTGVATVFDKAGAKLWHAPIPIVHDPVVPFLVNGHLLYVGPPGGSLVIVDAGSGHVIDRYFPASEPEGFGNPNTAYRLPYYRDGLIYLEGNAEVDSMGDPKDERVGGFEFRTKPRVYVVKVRF